MKKYFFTLIAIAILISCRKDSETNTTHSVEMINKSGQKISFKEYQGNDTIELDSLDVYLFTYNITGNEERNRGFFEDFGDSLRITYNDTTSIFHGCTRYSVARDARNALFYTHSKTLGINIHNYEYTFTNADYNEAVMTGDTL